MKNIKTILFDFDGTLADTIPTGIVAYNKVAKTLGARPINGPLMAKRLRSLGARDILSELNIPISKLVSIKRTVRTEAEKMLSTINHFPEIPEALLGLKNQGRELAILTSNTAGMVQKFLEEHELDKLFNFISSGSPLFGKAKKIRRVIKKHSLHPSEVAYVGDEVRDIEAAKKAGVMAVGVTWGVNSHEALVNSSADVILDHPLELQKI